MSGRLEWDHEGLGWPHRDASRFVRAGGLLWHVQVMGEGPVILLLHGTGASTHSWRALMPLLARHFTVVAPDLPGHGFTGTPPSGGFALPAVAAGVAGALVLIVYWILGESHVVMATAAWVTLMIEGALAMTVASLLFERFDPSGQSLEES